MLQTSSILSPLSSTLENRLLDCDCTLFKVCSRSLPGAVVVAKGACVVDSTIVIGAGDGNVA